MAKQRNCTPKQADRQSRTRCDLQGQILTFIHREQLVLPGDRVVVGVSGGPDSLCLAHTLWTCRDALGIEVYAAHLNHGIRGAEADADAQFVADLAAQWGMPCLVERRDVPAAAREHKLALEEAARRVRYAFLAETARNVRARRIAVGHNADDQSETVLMHWLRGAGLAGLRGMLPATSMAELRLLQPLPEEEALWLIRPLLETPRTDVLSYCRQHGLAPRFDRSNLDTTFYRNKLRHELLPYLEREFKPHFREILRRSARVIRADYDLLRRLRDSAWEQVVQQESDQAVMLDREGWHALHLSLQRAILRRAVQRLRWTLRDVSLEQIDGAIEVARRGEAGTRATLPRDLELTVGYARLYVAGTGFVPAPDFPALRVVEDAPFERVPLAVPGVTHLPQDGQVEIHVASRAELPAGWAQNPDPWRAFLDANVLGSELALRRRRPGDRFRPLGLGGRQKEVSEFLINAKVPAWWRDQVPLLVRLDDEIMWVCGWRIDERAKIEPNTSRVAVIRFDTARYD
jgi:tRNA(Ile)-lysidine synthase